MYFQGNVKTTPVTLENLNRGQKKEKPLEKCPPITREMRVRPMERTGGFRVK